MSDASNTGPLNPMQREVVLGWMRDQADPFTVQEVATFFSVHYMTARKWVTALKDESFIERYPMRRGRADLWVVSDSNNQAFTTEANQRAIRVMCGNEQLSVAGWACRNLGHASFAAIAHALVYLFVRSYYHNASEYEHLRGPIPVVEVRSFIAAQLGQIKRDMAAVEQLLQITQPWIEDGMFAQRFGEFPAGSTMTSVIEKAHFYVETIMKRGVVEAPIIEVEPAPKIEPPTVGDAMGRLKSPQPEGPNGLGLRIAPELPDEA